MYLDQYGIVRFQFFWGGTPKITPKKAKNSKKIFFLKLVPLTPYNNPVLLHNHVVLSKKGCLQKLEVKRLKFAGMAEIFAGDHIFSHFRACEKIHFLNKISRPHF